ncbi:MAG: hypothetical protein GC192_07355 [Bacteroidetes bacterium]|nr:hypothetical protein [Bacteroidota bacterium]
MKLSKFLLAFIIGSVFIFSCKKEDSSTSLNKVITIKFGETVSIDNEMTLTFTKIEEDSRCPCTADCDFTGQVVIRMVGNVAGASFDCPFPENGFKTFNDYETKLLEVFPGTCDLNSTTSVVDYKIKVIVKKL